MLLGVWHLAAWWECCGHSLSLLRFVVVAIVVVGRTGDDDTQVPDARVSPVQ